MACHNTDVARKERAETIVQDQVGVEQALGEIARQPSSYLGNAMQKKGAVTYAQTQFVQRTVEPEVLAHSNQPTSRELKTLVREIDYSGRYSSAFLLLKVNIPALWKCTMFLMKQFSRVVSAEEATRLHHSALRANEGRVHEHTVGSSTFAVYDMVGRGLSYVWIKCSNTNNTATTSLMA
jgi:hypothetical protein